MERLSDEPRKPSDLTERLARTSAARAEEAAQHARQSRPGRELAATILSAVVDVVEPGPNDSGRPTSASEDAGAGKTQAGEGIAETAPPGVSDNLLGIWEPGSDAVADSGDQSVSEGVGDHLLGIWEPAGEEAGTEPADGATPEGAGVGDHLLGIWEPGAEMAANSEETPAPQGVGDHLLGIWEPGSTGASGGEAGPLPEGFGAHLLGIWEPSLDAAGDIPQATGAAAADTEVAPLDDEAGAGGRNVSDDGGTSGVSVSADGAPAPVGSRAGDIPG